MIAGLVADAGGLAALWPDWEALWRRVPGNVFQSPAWLQPWWEVFGAGRPRVAVLRDPGGALRGLLPLCRLETPEGGKLVPFGAGITDYADALLDPALPPDAATALLAAALAEPDAVTDLPDLPPWSPLRAAPPPPGWQAASWADEPCPVLPLATQLEDTVPARKRRDLRMARHRAAAAGGWRSAPAGAGDLDAAFDALLRLHAQRWPGGGVLADPLVQDFHRRALPRLLQAGLLRLEVLRLGGEVAAVFYALLAGPERLYFYLGGFEAHFAHASPGTLILGHMLETAIAEGRREAHFLRGAEGYKYRWGAADRANLGRRFTPA